MSIIKQNARMYQHRISGTGSTPTAAITEDFTDGSWLATDIGIGEYCINITDGRTWFRDNFGIKEILTSGGSASSLMNVLAVNNHTGTNDIIIDTNQVIKSNSVGGQLSLDYFGSAGEISLDTDNGNQSESYLYLTPTSSELYSLGNSVSLNSSRADISVSNSSYIHMRAGTLGLFIDGRYNNSGTMDIIKFLDNYSATYSTANTVKPTVAISSQNCIIATSSINSIVSGVGNTASYTSNYINGENNSINNNAITGHKNNILSGKTNIINGGSGLVDTTNSIVSGTSNKSNNVNNSFMIGSFNYIDGGFNNGIIYGIGNTASNSCDSNLIGGTGNATNGTFGAVLTSSIMIGNNNRLIASTLNGSNLIAGQLNVIGDINESLIVGRNNNVQGNSGLIYGQNGNIGTSGFSQMAITTTDATPSILYRDVENTRNFNILINTAYRVKLTAIAADTATGDCKEWEGFGIIKNVGGTTSLVSAITMTSTVADGSLAAITLTATANNTNDTLELTATGIAATTINWVCGIQYEKINH